MYLVLSLFLLRTTIIVIGSFLDAFQKVADIATGTRGENSFIHTYYYLLTWCVCDCELEWFMVLPIIWDHLHKMEWKAQNIQWAEVLQVPWCCERSEENDQICSTWQKGSSNLDNHSTIPVSLKVYQGMQCVRVSEMHQQQYYGQSH